MGNNTAFILIAIFVKLRWNRNNILKIKSRNNYQPFSFFLLISINIYKIVMGLLLLNLIYLWLLRQWSINALFFFFAHFEEKVWHYKCFGLSPLVCFPYNSKNIYQRKEMDKRGRTKRNVVTYSPLKEK